MEFVETPSFWCLQVDRAACNNFSTRTIELQPSEHWEILHFSFSSFLSFSFFFRFFPFLRTLFFLYLVSLFSFLFSFICFLFPLFLTLTQRILFFFVPILFHFLIIFFSFSLFFWKFLFSFFFGAYLTIRSKEEISSPFPHAICVALKFSFISFISFIASSHMWLIVSHTFKCTIWLLPCVTLLGCHVASP